MQPKRTQRGRPRLAMLAAALVPLAANPGAGADVVESEWNSSSDFRYFIYHMPDFDQKRSVLPNNGNMYCVPTSAMNLMAYIGNHGFPEVAPGSGDWQSPSNYDAINLALVAMGTQMSTDPFDGTGSTGLINGLNSWLPNEKFIATYMGANGAWAPKIQDFGGSAITGALVMFCYGRYDITGFINGFPVISRQSGHCVTLSRIDVNGSDWLLWVRNPSHADGDNVSQALFANQALDPAPRVAVPDSILPAFFTRTYTELLVEGSAQLRLIDSYATIRTKQGYSFDDTGGTVQVISPFGNLAGASPTIPFDIPAGRDVEEVIPLPDGLGFATLQHDAATGVQFILLLQTIGPDVQEIASVEVDGACSMVMGDNRMLYVLCGDVLELIDPDDRLRKLKRVNLPWPCSKVLYDDERDMVYLLPEGGDPMIALVFPKDLEGDPAQKPIPSGALPTNPCVGACGTDGNVYLADTITGEMYCIPPTFDSFQAFQLGAFAGVEAMDVDDRGHLFVVSGGALTEVMPDGEGGWQIDRSSAWDGMRVGKFFKIDRTRSNFDPNDPAMVELADNTVPDDSEEAGQWATVEDCLADINGDLVVDIDDLLAMLAMWGSSDPLHDIAPAGGDGTVGIDDLLYLLSRWGDCGL